MVGTHGVILLTLMVMLYIYCVGVCYVGVLLYLLCVFVVV